MRKIVSWLRRFTDWLEPFLDPRMKRVIELIEWADNLKEGISGERKRNQVLSRLVDEFPDSRVRDLSYMIEYALQRREK